MLIRSVDQHMAYAMSCDCERLLLFIARQTNMLWEATVNLFQKCVGVGDVGDSAHSDHTLSRRG